MFSLGDVLFGTNATYNQIQSPKRCSKQDVYTVCSTQKQSGWLAQLENSNAQLLQTKHNDM